MPRTKVNRIYVNGTCTLCGAKRHTSEHAPDCPIRLLEWMPNEQHIRVKAFGEKIYAVTIGDAWDELGPSYDGYFVIEDEQFVLIGGSDIGLPTNLEEEVKEWLTGVTRDAKRY